MAAENDCFGCKVLTRIRDSKFPSEKISLISEKDNQKHEIHAIVLAASSKNFTALLGRNFQEGKNEGFLLKDVDGETVKEIINFCYSGSIDLTEQNVSKFLDIASSADIDLLEEKCCRFYGENLSFTNCIETLMVADTYSYEDLRQRAFDFICGSFEHLPASEIHNMDRLLLQEMLMSNKIHLAEDSVFQRLLEWFQRNENERRQYMPELLKLIRLERVTPEFICDTVHAVYTKFHLPELLLDEYQRRISSQVRRSRPIFNLFLLNMEDGANSINVEKYNEVLGRFEEGVEIILGHRTSFNAILHKNQLFVLGGETNGRYLNSVSSYDLDFLQESVLPPMINAREDCVPFSSGNFIYMFGGSQGRAISFCECFDTVAKEWKKVKSMKNIRRNAAAAALNGYIYVAGGIGVNECRSVELYDPKLDEWTQIKPMNIGRCSFALIEFNGFLYAMGGVIGTVEKYDPYKDCWTEIGTFVESEYISSGINVDGQIFVISYNDRFVEVKIDEDDKCTFIPLAKSNYESTVLGNHFLYQN